MHHSSIRGPKFRGLSLPAPGPGYITHRSVTGCDDGEAL